MNNLRNNLISFEVENKNVVEEKFTNNYFQRNMKSGFSSRQLGIHEKVFYAHLFYES